MASDPTILVTGAAGYIATHVVQQLQKAGHRVRGTVRSLDDEQKVEALRNLCPTAKYPIELIEADLMKADSWLDAVRGCSYVMHTASPVLLKQPTDEMEVITPTVEGTLSVLRACKAAGGVKRVVLTSSIVAVTGGIENRKTDATFSEENWTDPTKTKVAYTKGKTIAEKAAWDFVGKLKDEERFELAVILPCVVMGPVLCGGKTASMELLRTLLERAIPALPNTNFALVDVRDVAAAHLAAMTLPEAAGHRHIVAPHNMWFKEIAELIHNEFEPLGYSIPLKLAPYFAVKIFSLVNDRAKFIILNWGITSTFDTTRMISVLGIQPRPLHDTLISMAYSMINKGFVKKTTKYTEMMENKK